MPNAAFHDAVTIILAVPAIGAAYSLTGDAAATGAAGLGFLFGGLMFGPDLDTVSRQYSRWGPLRLLWYPYRSVFRHRSRWSHGLTFGASIRVIYFFGVITLGLAAIFAGVSMITGADAIGTRTIETLWVEAGGQFRDRVGISIAIAAFAGCWLGAASHTMTDIAVSYIKTGRISEFL
jgi:uncharacterized metal-binding protein